MFYDGKIDTIEYVKLAPRSKYWKQGDQIETVDLSKVEVRNFLKANYAGIWTPDGYQFWYSSSLDAPDCLFAHQDYIIADDWKKSYFRLLVMTADAGKRRVDNVAAEQTNAQSGF
jgi:hypothetical protein